MTIRKPNSGPPYVGQDWPGVDVDEKAKVSANDTTAGYLNGKLVAGTGISLTENNDGGNETLTITNTSAATDEKAKVSANDTTAGYLNGKLVAGTGISFTENNDAGNETLTITNTGSGQFRKTHCITPDAMDYEGGATLTDYLSTNNSNRIRCIEMPEGSDIHFSIPMHPKYAGGDISCRAYWVVVDASHNTQHSMEYNARYARNTDTLDVNETEVAWTWQADTANDLLYVDSATLTVEGTYSTNGTLLHFRLGHKSSCAASGALKLLSVEISYACTREDTGSDVSVFETIGNLQLMKMGNSALGYDATTGEFGTLAKLTNGTGSATVKGSVVSCSQAADSRFILQANEYDALGVVAVGGIADGSDCWVWKNGSKCQVLLKDTTTTTRGQVAICADTDGRFIGIANPGSGLPAVDTHFKEIGHVWETKGSGTNVLVLCDLHFN